MSIIIMSNLRKFIMTIAVVAFVLMTAGELSAMPNSLATTSVFSSARGLASHSYAVRSLPLMTLALLSYVVTIGSDDPKAP